MQKQFKNKQKSQILKFFCAFITLSAHTGRLPVTVLIWFWGDLGILTLLTQFWLECLKFYLDEKSRERGLTPESFKEIETQKGNAKAV